MTKLLGGRYDLQDQIGGGGMAVVYRAVDTLLARQVAVKMLRSQFAGDEEFVSRFRREAQSAASLSHPNIVNLYDVGVTEGNEYYIVMEYVDGPTLKDVIRERGPLPVKEVLEITRQICDALEHAHDHHIIHRDIKPHNILLTKNGHVKVADFGIARANSGNTITHHHSNSVLGSVHYFSPEQARGGATDVKSDIYSLGVVMYEMLTGKLPFSGDSPVSVALKHLREHFIEPREIIKTIPQSVENIVLRCLVKSPDARYPDMKALKKDLQDALIRPNAPKFVAPETVPEETIAVPVVGGKMYGEEEPGRNAPAKKKRKWWNVLGWSGIALAVLLVGAFAAYYIVMNLVQVPNTLLPDVRGKTYTQAVSMLEHAGFQKNQIVEQKANNVKPEGVVYDQDPPGPTEVKQTRTITLWVSLGPQQQQMPDLTGVSVDEAIQTLRNMGITNVQEQQVPSSSVDPGLVVSTTPAKDQPLSANTQVVLQVSGGSLVTIPNIIGMSLNDAEAALKNANLQVGQVTRQPANAQNGNVFAIAPYKVNAQVPQGSTVNLFVADNSGESGGGIGTGNGTGDSGSGTGSSGQPGNAVVKTLDVQVNDPAGKAIRVQIYKTDAVSSKQLVVDETIRATKLWTVTVQVTPSTPGEIIVYENGRQEQDYHVSYQDH